MGAPKKQEITQKTEIPKYIKRATAGVDPSSAAFQSEQQAIKDFYGLADGGYVSAYRRGGPVFQGLGSTPQAAEAFRRFGGAFGGMRTQPAVPMGRPGRPPMQGMPGRPPMQGMPGRPPMQGMPGRPPMPPMQGRPGMPAEQQRAQILEMMKARPATGVPPQQALPAAPGVRPPMPPGPPQVMGGKPPMPAAQPGVRPPMPPGSLGGMRPQPAMPAGRPAMPAMPAGRPAPPQPGFANGGMVGQPFNPLDLTSPAMAYYMAQGAQGYAQGGYIEGPGNGRSDSIPATIHQNGVPVQDAALSDGEFVMTERAVRGAGNGDREAGAARMYEMMRRFEGRG